MGLDAARALELRAAIARERDGQAVSAAGRDPLVDRHGRELFGQIVEPDLTPPELRHVAPRRVLLEWIGQPSPFASETVLALKARGMLTAFHLHLLERAALKCIARVDGMTSRTLTAERDGLTETVRWGPKRGTFIREVAMVDAERILASPAGPEFRIVGKEARESRHDPDQAWKDALAGLRAISQRQGLPLPPTDAEASRIRLRVAAEERLAKLGRTNQDGIWQ
jgi:hypothetical protein